MRFHLKDHDLTFLLKSGGSFSLRFAEQFFTLLVAMLLTRLLSVSDFGAYSIVMAAMMIFAIPIREGAPHLWTRYAAIYQSRSDYKALNGLIITALLYTLTVGGALMLAFWGMRDVVLPYLNGVEADDYVYALWFIPLTGLLFATHGVLKGLHHVLWAQIPEYFIRPCLFALLLMAALFVMSDAYQFTVFEAFSYHIFGGFLALVCACVFILRALPRAAWSYKPCFHIKEWQAVLWPLIAYTGLILLNQNADIVMLGAMSGQEEAGLYQVATRTANWILAFLSAVNGVISPSISKLYTEGRMLDLQRLIRKASVLVTLCTLPLLLASLVGAGFILSSLYGAAYTASTDAFMILCVAQAVNAFAGPVGLVLIMTGAHKLGLIGVASSAIVNISLNYVLIPLYGIEGAAIATGISVVVWNVLLSIFVWRRLGLSCSILPWTKVK